MSVVCPQGHVSQATDYCDTCGAPLDASAPSASSSGSASLGRVGPRAAARPRTGRARRGDHGVPALPGDQPGRRVVLRGVRVRLHHRCATPRRVGARPGRAGGPARRGSGPGRRRVPGRASASAPAPDPAGGDVAPAPLAPAVPLEWVAELWVDPAWYAEQEADEPCPSPGLPVIVPLTVRSVLVGRVSRSRNIHPEVDCGADIGVSRRQAQLSTDGTRWWIEDLQSSNGTYVGPASGPLPAVPLVPGQRRELAEGDRVYVGAWTRIVVRRATEEERTAG